MRGDAREASEIAGRLIAIKMAASFDAERAVVYANDL
jgi:hypothetical protein